MWLVWEKENPHWAGCVEWVLVVTKVWSHEATIRIQSGRLPTLVVEWLCALSTGVPCLGRSVRSYGSTV